MLPQAWRRSIRGSSASAIRAMSRSRSGSPSRTARTADVSRTTVTSARKALRAVAEDLVRGSRIASRASGASLCDPRQDLPALLARDGSAQALESFADRHGDGRGDALASFGGELTSEPVSVVVFDVLRHDLRTNNGSFLPSGAARSLSAATGHEASRPAWVRLPIARSRRGRAGGCRRTCGPRAGFAARAHSRPASRWASISRTRSKS